MRRTQGGVDAHHANVCAPLARNKIDKSGQQTMS